MGISIRNENIRRLASLTALGTGALGITAGPAGASSIIYSGIIDETVGPAIGSNVSFADPNGAGGVLSRFQGTGIFSGFTSVVLRARPGVHGTDFRFLTLGSFFAGAAPLGAKWSTAIHSGSNNHGNVGYSGCLFSICSAGSSFNATDRYLLFRFTGGDLPSDNYGRAQLKVVNNVDTTLVDWAYDSSGAQIPAGDTGAPEPSTFVLTGLAALALGARGLRSWRVARMSRPSASLG